MDSSSEILSNDFVFVCGYDDTQNEHSQYTLLTPIGSDSHIQRHQDGINKTISHEQYLHLGTQRRLKELFRLPIYYGSALDQMHKKIHAQQLRLIMEHFDDILVEADEKLTKKNSTLTFRTSSKLNKKIVIKLSRRIEPGFYADFNNLTLDPDAANQLTRIKSFDDALSFIQKYGHVYPMCEYYKISQSYIGVEITGAKEPNELFSMGVSYLKECSVDQFKHDLVSYHPGNADSSKYSYKIKTLRAELPPLYEPMHPAQMLPISEVIFDRVSENHEYLDTHKNLVQKANEFERLSSFYLSSSLDATFYKFDVHAWNRASEFWSLYVRQPILDSLRSDPNINAINLDDFKDMLDHQFSAYKETYQPILINSASLGFYYLNRNYHLNSAILELKNKSRKIMLIFFDRNLIATRSVVWTNIVKYATNYVHRIKMASVLLVDYEMHPYLKEKMLAYKKCFYIEYLFRLAGMVRLGLNYSNQGRMVFNDIKLTDSANELNLSRNNLIVLNKYQFNDYFYACFLKELNLKNCSLYELESSCFENMNVLEVLNLSGNYLKKLGAHFSCGLNELKVLNVSNCELDTLDERAFKYLTNLYSLDLSYNRLKCIKEKHLENLISLESLNLGHNKIEHFENNMVFLTMGSLKKLYLNSNMFSSVDPFLFISLIDLEVLSLAGNKIPTLKNIFGNLKNLKLLALNNCQIGKIADDAFEELESLEIMFLHMNDVEFNDKMFRYLKNLQVLTLYSRDREKLDQYKFLLERAQFEYLKYFVHRYNEKKIDNLISKFSKHSYSNLINDLYLKNYL